MTRILKAFGFAITGLRSAVNRDLNFRVHIAVSVTVILMGLSFSISANEWFAIILAIGITFSAELFNSALEQLCDTTHPGIHPTIGRVKDISAAAVLIAALSSAIIGIMIFLPHIINHATQLL